MFAILSRSEPGGHALNEDAFAVQAHPIDADCLVCVVADGMGGQPGGGEAAWLACQVCLEKACALPVERLFFPGAWASICRAADEAVARAPDADPPARAVPALSAYAPARQDFQRGGDVPYTSAMRGLY